MSFLPLPVGIILSGGNIDYPGPAMCLTCLTITLVVSPLVYADFYSPAPPTERFLGKSPEYIIAYKLIYVKEVKRRRRLSFIAGLGTTLIPLVSYGCISDINSGGDPLPIDWSGYLSQ